MISRCKRLSVSVFAEVCLSDSICIHVYRTGRSFASAAVFI